VALARQPAQLVRGLGALDAVSLVVGTVIGTGVFLKSAIMAQLVGTPMLVLAAWIAAGLVSLAGALTYAELGAMLPETGGEYVFLRAAYGRAVAFQYGWMRAIVGASASAAVATGLATFLGSLVSLGGDWARVDLSFAGHLIHWAFGARQLVAVAAIAGVAFVNCVGVTAGGRTQTVLAAIKVTAVLLIIVAVFGGSGAGTWGHFRAPASPPPAAVSGLGGPAAFGAAVVAALWAYTGWSYLPIAAGEIRDPQRTVPRAIIGGMLIVIALYVVVNAAYAYALPTAAIATASSTAYPNAPAVATKAVATFLSAGAGRAVTTIFIISALGTLNGSMLTTPRVAFAMARDGQFFSAFGTLGTRSHAPVFSIATYAAVAGILAASGTYDQLTDLTVFAYAIFYVLTAASLFVLRRTKPDAVRPYRTIGYPWVPLVFVIASGWLVINMVHTNPLEAWLVLVLLACGVPAYLAFSTSRTCPLPPGPST
jgi:basic amino acid/polyamine antiporter, APA family